MSSGQNYREKLFAAKSLDIEQIILTAINEIMVAPLKIAELGDIAKVNAMMEGLVLNLDAFVSRILLTEEHFADSKYQKDRTKIIETWPTDSKPNMNLVRDLFKLTVEALQERRLFKVKRYSYFGMGWKKTQKINLEEMQKQDELEGEPGEEQTGES